MGRRGVTQNGYLVAEGMIECRLRRFCAQQAAIVRLVAKPHASAVEQPGRVEKSASSGGETLVRGGKLFLISGFWKLQGRRVLV